MIYPIQVRPVAQTNFAAGKILWDGYNAFYGQHHETALPLEITEMRNDLVVAFETGFAHQSHMAHWMNRLL